MDKVTMDEMAQEIDAIIIDLLVPARAEKKMHKPTLKRFHAILDQLIEGLKDNDMLSRKLTSILILIYESLSAEAQYCEPGSEFFMCVAGIEEKIYEIFRG